MKHADDIQQPEPRPYDCEDGPVRLETWKHIQQFEHISQEILLKLIEKLPISEQLYYRDELRRRLTFLDKIL